MIGKFVSRSDYYVEQMTFLASLLPYIARFMPHVIFFSDSNLRTPLWYWRQLTHQKYKILLSNGGPVGPPFPRCEHVHQVLPSSVQESIAFGYPAWRQTFIPYGFVIPPHLRALTRASRASLRAKLGLPCDRPLFLSVGALNASHKRMDYVIREVASLPPPRPYLLLLGNVESESPPIIRLGIDLLGEDGFRATSVPYADISAYYQVADAFVLASLSEGFGRVYVEALAHGLPCLAHDSAAARSVLGEHGLFGDLRIDRTLAELIRGLHLTELAGTESLARHRYAYEQFSWDRLSDRYVEMIRRCATEPISGGGDLKSGSRSHQ